MPVDSSIAIREWARFQQLRDNGHEEFVIKADMCEQFLAGKQWRDEDLAALRLARRPALTINKILPTVCTVLGSQIENRAEISFRPARGGTGEVADALAKVFKHISNDNQLDWVRSEVFADGYIRSRGFFDVRVDTDDSMQGTIRVTRHNSKNVLIDSDAEEYDPETWNDVITTKWLTADMIEVMYGKEDADVLRSRSDGYFNYGYDTTELNRDRFGQRTLPLFSTTEDLSAVIRNIRILERQHRVLDRQKHFVERETGEMRAIPPEFDRNRIAFFVEKYGFAITTKLVRRIRWTVVADNLVLHDDWSPYRDFTIVPYFPIFRSGTTIGGVENLLGSQELLNKSSSQELHVVNTSANSGWKFKSGSLVNMTAAELEEKGAQTGLVVEMNGDPDKDLIKITPNQVPQGFDRLSFKAEDHIKSISGINDSMAGFDREDVAAKAIEKKKASGATGLGKQFDSLTRTDTILARVILNQIQDFYTEERIMTITKDAATGDTEQITVNQATPEGTIVNDLTLGEYEVVVVSVPHRETMEDSQFEQALSLKELGVNIPDSVLINSSRLMNKAEIIRTIEGDKDSPEAQAQAQLQQRGQEAAVSKVEAEVSQKQADAGLKQAKAQATQVAAQKEAQTPPDDGDGDNGVAAAQQHIDVARTHAELNLKQQAQDHQQQIDQQTLAMQREKNDNDTALKAQQLADKRRQDAALAAQKAATAALHPPTEKA